MKIQVVGPGCAKCQSAEKNLTDACTELGIDADIFHIYDVKEIGKLGVMLTPAVLVDGKIVVSGKVPTVSEFKRILSEIK